MMIRMRERDSENERWMDRCRGNYIKKVFRDKHTEREKGALTSEKLYDNRKITDLCFARDGRTRIVSVTTGHTQVTAICPLLVARLSTRLPLGLTGTLERKETVIVVIGSCCLFCCHIEEDEETYTMTDFGTFVLYAR